MHRTILLAALLAAASPAWAQNEEKAKEAATEVKAAAPVEKAEAKDPLHPRATMTTTLGDIVLELDAEKAPITVRNFLQYATDGYYEGTIFHRVVSNFMIQGGGFTAELDKKEDGIRPPIKNEWRNGLKNARGTISMARTQDPDSATSQFFINVVDNKMLDQARDGAAYCVFGRVVSGMEVVDKIKDTEVTTNPKLPMGKVVPVETVEIKSVKLGEGWTYEATVAATKDAIEAQEKAEKEREAKETAKKDTMKTAFEQLLEKKEDENGNKLQTTESGLMYVVLQEGEGEQPKPTDQVEVHYTGWLMDGTKFDSSVDRGIPTTFPLNRVISGWTEGVGLMKPGGKLRLLIPYNLAYGERGRPPRIPPKAMLVFDVELLSIK